MTTTLTDADGGTDVLVVHEGVRDAVPAADNQTSTRMRWRTSPGCALGVLFFSCVG